MDKEQVQSYYGSTLKASTDLKTTACCSAPPPKHLQPILKMIDPEIRAKFYGCGSPIPDVVKGKTILDLGCGTGRDVYMLSYLAGNEGKVIGVDMTEEQLSVAKKHLDSQMKRFDFNKSNVEFLHGDIEDLKALGIEDNSVDIVVSNCVLNLAPNKEKVFGEILRVLKPGGELYFSDVFADRRIPPALKKDPILVGECLSGAMYIEDFRRLLLKLGFPDFRIVAKTNIELDDEEVFQKIGMTTFCSLTIRLFKVPLEDQCEDYGQLATYLGTIPHNPHEYVLDNHHTFPKGKPIPVCSNTAFILNATRFQDHFKVQGDLSTHYGLFDCSSDSKEEDNSQSGGCC